MKSRDGPYKLKPTRPKLQVDTYPREGVALDTGFPEALALLSPVGIREAGSREFCPEGITALLFHLLPVPETTHLCDQQRSSRSPY